jgi:phenylacetate-CoA ligase
MDMRAGKGYWTGARELINLRSNQWKNEEERRKIRDKKLRAIVDYAYRKTRFYKDIFDSNKIKPENIKGIEDLEKLPIVTKDMVRDNPKAFVSSDSLLGELKKSSTSGSTGVPLSIYHDIKSHAYATALIYYAFIESGVGPFDVGMGTTRVKQMKSFKGKLGIFRKHKIPIGLSVGKHVELIKSFKPDYIYYQPSIMEILASHVLDNGINVKFKKFFSKGETLYEETRSLVRDAFECEIYDTYGSIEFWRIAFECGAHEGLHIIDDSVIVEFMGNQGPVNPGEKGEITVSGLYNYSMPLLRYKLDDIGIYSHEGCSCGRKWPILKSIEGRIDDFLIATDGRKISPRTIVYSFSSLLVGIKQYQVIQWRKNKIEFKFIKGRGFNEKNLNRIKRSFEKILGTNIEVLFTEKKFIRSKKWEKIKKVTTKVKK